MSTPAICRMRRRGLALCLTLAVADAVARFRSGRGAGPAPEGVCESRASFAAAFTAHVPICMGGDVGVFAHRPKSREMALVQAAGVTPPAVLVAATAGDGHAFHLQDRGEIKPGILANLVVVAGDPTRNVAALGHVRR